MRIARAVEYRGHAAPAVLQIPEPPVGTEPDEIALLPDSIWLVTESDYTGRTIYQLVGDEWVAVKCRITQSWFDSKPVTDEVEYEFVPRH